MLAGHDFACLRRIATVASLVALLVACTSEIGGIAADAPLPVRPGPRTVTSYSVPHIQHFVDPVPEVDAELRASIFALPDLERRESIVSITGTEALWLADEVDLADPAAVLRAREFGHIHPDGSLHVVLPVDRAVEAIEAKWAEFHPWVGSEDVWDGMVMLYTPQTAEEGAVILQLVVDSYNFVTGRSVTVDELG